MKFQPTYVFMMSASRRFLRNSAAGASADPIVAVVMTHFEPGLGKEVEVALDAVEFELVEL